MNTNDQQQLIDLNRQAFEHVKSAQRIYAQVKKRRARLPIKVSDHAVLRYLERVTGIDMQSVKEAILTDQLQKLHTLLGNGTFPIGDNNVRAVVEKGVVVTILI